MTRVDKTIRHYASKNDYLAKRPSGPLASKLAKKGVPGKTPLKDPKAPEIKKPEVKAPESSPEKPSPNAPSAPSLGSKILDAAKTAGKAVIDAPPIPKSIPSLEASNKTKKISPKKEETVINRPAIIFVEGLNLLSSSGSDSGLEKMAKAIPKTEQYGWANKDEIVESISKRPTGQPIILVGHSYGGDTIVEVANELNSVEHGFKKIDLLVTLDSIGMNNDIIPPNVLQNLNFIEDGTFSFINDEPNIARDTNKTSVINELRYDGHRGVDDSKEVQMKIFEKIEEVLGKAIRKRDLTQLVQNARMIHKKLENAASLKHVNE